MEAVLGFIGPVFWGLVVLSALVFVHEGGHFLAARLCGVRVTEFFLGMPCRFNIHHVSKRIGTKFGITPILLGGYAEICGMDPTDSPYLSQVLSYIYSKGEASVEQIAEDLTISEDDAMQACVLLLGWGSLAPRYVIEKGEKPGGSYYPSRYATMPRDDRGNTIYDGSRFDAEHATAEGQPWLPPMDADQFCALERSRTYIGVGFWKRAFMLVAGIAVNILIGFLLVVAVYSAIGVEAPVNVNILGSVSVDSPAQAAGLEPGDKIVLINGVQTKSWTDITSALEKLDRNKPIQLEVVKQAGDQAQLLSVQADKDGKIGIGASTETVRLNPIDSCRIAAANIAQTALAVANLLNPVHAKQILDNSTSIIGISVMSSQAAAAGPAVLLNFAAIISFSLGFMNLLPIPPLDGGKLFIEIIQAVMKRKVPLKIQNFVSIVGVVLFGLLFLYMLRADILRFF